jgi:hypothetical protein
MIGKPGTLHLKLRDIPLKYQGHSIKISGTFAKKLILNLRNLEFMSQKYVS